LLSRLSRLIELERLPLLPPRETPQDALVLLSLCDSSIMCCYRIVPLHPQIVCENLNLCGSTLTKIKSSRVELQSTQDSFPVLVQGVAMISLHHKCSTRTRDWVEIDVKNHSATLQLLVRCVWQSHSDPHSRLPAQK
jgi:hypothetical protein